MKMLKVAFSSLEDNKPPHICTEKMGYIFPPSLALYTPLFPHSVSFLNLLHLSVVVFFPFLSSLLVITCLRNGKKNYNSVNRIKCFHGIQDYIFLLKMTLLCLRALFGHCMLGLGLKKGQLEIKIAK